jgi:hypothetical protein
MWWVTSGIIGWLLGWYSHLLFKAGWTEEPKMSGLPKAGDMVKLREHGPNVRVINVTIDGFDWANNEGAQGWEPFTVQRWRIVQ